jgi:phage terminase large subunit
MSNRKIADYINNSAFPNALIIADPPSPRVSPRCRSTGPDYRRQEGPGSVNQGIQWVQDQRMSVTKRSTNVIKSYRNYMWKTDRDGNVLDIPDHAFSDAMDAVRYAMESMKPAEDG